ncbi:MAG: PA2169 family four-helix-bundle protein [Elusimicrobia bacterium]|nr:PA2169 family four-helix-bundle protein [Elusimicrobiota bacterium]
MATQYEKTISLLNELIETCRDGENGFRTAADGVEDSELKDLFHRYSQQRAQFTSELKRVVSNLGGRPEERGSAAGAAHRGWINIKSAVTGKDEDAIISEAERGEDAAVRSYQDVLNQDLPSDVRAIVESQYSLVKEAHDHISALERAGRPDD